VHVGMCVGVRGVLWEVREGVCERDRKRNTWDQRISGLQHGDQMASMVMLFAVGKLLCFSRCPGMSAHNIASSLPQSLVESQLDRRQRVMN
jgi:hypothetical protein